MKNFTFVIVDDNQTNGLKTRAVAQGFQNLTFLASAGTYEDGLDCVLEYNPDIVFLEIDPADKDSNLSLAFINELHRYLTVVPKIFITTKNDALCLSAFKYGVFDYFINPIESKELRKTLFRLDKELAVVNIATSTPITSAVVVDSVSASATILATAPPVTPEETKNSEVVVDNSIDINSVVINSEEVASALESISVEKESDALGINDKEISFLQTENTDEKPLLLCIKSYGDYRYIEAKDICYLQADNNSTDIHLQSGEMITAFKTLKHFEGVMSYPFVRIHNSYIVNIEFVSRIHTGNAVCHIKNTTTKLPFSKSYKENIDAIITTIASGNYLEI